MYGVYNIKYGDVLIFFKPGNGVTAKMADFSCSALLTLSNEVNEQKGLVVLTDWILDIKSSLVSYFHRFGKRDSLNCECGYGKETGPLSVGMSEI
jgi:hypothetical protein